MIYNTQQKKLPLPEYGRAIQNMVDYALTLEDRAERQRCANTIINIMGTMFPHLRDVPDFKHKLWDHLTIMPDCKLNIDYPYEVIRKDNLSTRPDPIPYRQQNILYKHYGRTLEELIPIAAKMPEGDEKEQLVALIANHMRKSYVAWNKESVDEEKINDDLMEYSEGQLYLTDNRLRLMDMRMNAVNRFNQQRQPGNGNNNSGNRGGGNNNARTPKKR